MASRASRGLVPLIIMIVALLLAPMISAVAAPLPAVGTEIRGGGDLRPGTQLPKVPVMTGTGGAVTSVDRDASQIGIDVLRAGGNAADAAVATAAALGVTEPYSAGIGGGGFLVYYDAKRGKVFTIDGRETAPATFTDRTFIDSATGTPLVFADVVSSGLSVGVPGTPALWEKAASQFGTRSIRDLLRPAEQLAERGFVVDETFAQQTRDNEARFRKFPETTRIFLPGGSVPAVGSTFRNPDLAAAYRTLRYRGIDELYRGEMGDALVRAAQEPVTAPGVSVYPGQITSRDLRRYRALTPEPTRTKYRGLDLYGMPVPSSGGSSSANHSTSSRPTIDGPAGCCPRWTTSNTCTAWPRPTPPPLPTATAGSVTCVGFRPASCCPRASPTSGPASCSTPPGLRLDPFRSATRTVGTRRRPVRRRRPPRKRRPRSTARPTSR